MAARIAGVNLPDNKRIVIALTYINGIGKSRSQKLLAQVGISPDKRAKELTEQEVNSIRQAIEKNAYVLEGDLKRMIFTNIKRLKETGSWRGIRHSRHLPVRGQRTQTNSRPVRGNVRKPTTSGRKPTAQKT